MFRRYPLRCLAYLVIALGLITATAWAFTAERTTLGLVALIAAALVVGRFIYWSVAMSATAVIVTNRKVTVETGVFTREATEVPLKEITSIQIEQDAIQGVLGVGDLAIQCERGSKQAVLVLGLWAPEVIVQQINAAKG
jgi:uncharacterized membrane protein YdbT with pleckstrin-like domain